MMPLLENFVRDQFGSWLCVKPAELELPGARVHVAPGTRFTRGTSIVDVDVAALLDDEWDALRTTCRGG